ncbi:MAG: hypothetical protein DHS80DRAFT_31518 [Piptocephalis tieghemiana]|nr:MAG: hypothetical protein DHS80DRAFT_31518 [Piptocephalis tieghemiana]
MSFLPSSHMLFKTGCALGALGVGLGAYGSHGLPPALAKRFPDLPKERMDRKLKNWDTAVSYHLVHAVVMCLAASRGHRVAGTLFLTGILGFSGSMYALTLGVGPTRVLGPATPLGGLGLMAAWISMIF